MRTSLRRPDWLNELHGLLKVAATLTAIAAVATTATTLAGRPLDVEVNSSGTLPSEALVDLPAGVSIDSGLRLQVDQPTGAQRGWELLATLPSLLLLVVSLILLWRLVDRTRRGDPFTSDIAGRFRTLGLLLVAGGPAVWALESVGEFALSVTVAPDAPYAPLHFAVPGAWILCGFVMFAFGEIVRRGQALRAELDGVV